jgi:hypothetical protein
MPMADALCSGRANPAAKTVDPNIRRPTADDKTHKSFFISIPPIRDFEISVHNLNVHVK